MLHRATASADYRYFSYRSSSDPESDTGHDRADRWLGGYRSQPRSTLGGVGVVARRSKVVRGIVLKNDQLSLDGWVAELTRALVQQSSASSADRLALERLLG